MVTTDPSHRLRLAECLDPAGADDGSEDPMPTTQAWSGVRYWRRKALALQ